MRALISLLLSLIVWAIWMGLAKISVLLVGVSFEFAVNVVGIVLVVVLLVILSELLSQ